MTDRRSKNLSKFPKYGWKVKLDHEFPETRDQNLRPRLTQMLPLIPLGLRYIRSEWRPLIGPDQSKYCALIGVTD